MSIRAAALAAGAAGALACGGCASIVSGQNQSISVLSTNQGADLAGAPCSLANDKGTWYATTPGSVTVRRSFNDLVVECAAEGAPRGSAAVKSSTKPMAFGNILFGGVIGVGVDAVSGTAYDYCMREGRPCWLYAVDDRVVWSPDVDKRIGRSAQLFDR